MMEYPQEYTDPNKQANTDQAKDSRLKQGNSRRVRRYTDPIIGQSYKQGANPKCQ